jgi:hypothetical protein
MTINASGPVSLADATAGQSIALELGLGTSTTISLNDTAVRSLAGVASGVVSLGDFYGMSNTFSFTLSSGQNINLRTAAIAAGWDQVKILIATLNSGGAIGSSATGTYALTINGAYAKGVTFINNGYVVGMGGAGGPGGNGGNPGTAGGPALSVASAVTIQNNGTIGGGGGGGGGGGHWSGITNGVGGGGGGAGNTAGSGGAGSAASGFPQYYFNTSSPGTLTTGGSAAPNSTGGGGGTGGTGGNLGSAGATGGAGSGGAGGAGGAAGICTSGGSNITWSVAGSRLGTLA